MAIAHQVSRRAGITRIDPTDLRTAGGLMLLIALLRPLVPWEPGVLCPLRATTGVPCPLCGMTTSVTAAVHLDLPAALGANPAGLLAVGLATYLLVRRPPSLPVSLPLIILGLVAMWLFELNRYGIV